MDFRILGPLEVTQVANRARAGVAWRLLLATLVVPATWW
jgi:hypothetical protein